MSGVRSSYLHSFQREHSLPTERDSLPIAQELAEFVRKNHPLVWRVVESECALYHRVFPRHGATRSSAQSVREGEGVKLAKTEREFRARFDFVFGIQHRRVPIACAETSSSPQALVAATEIRHSRALHNDVQC